MSRFIYEMWMVTLDVAPSLILGLFIAGLLHVFLRRERISRHLGRPGAASSAKAALLGVPLPLCSCGVIPAAMSLRMDGASPGATTSFLVSTPETGVDSIALTAGMLGWPVAAVKVAAAFLAGFVSGVIVDSTHAGSGIRPAPAAPETCGAESGGRPRRLWHYAFSVIFRDLYGWLAVGIVISALLSMLVPAGSLAGVSWLQGPLGLLAALVVGIPMYVCSTASVPIAAGLVQAGFPAGAAIVFLMAGPATNAATLGAVRKTLGGRVFVIYLGTIVFFSLLAGLVMNAIGFSPGPAVAEGPSPLHVLQVAAGGILAAGIAWFAGMDLLALLSRLRARASTGSTILAVDEINCPTCESKVRTALLQLEGVRAAVVSRDSGTAFLSTAPGFDPEKALELVKGLGYTARLL
jgi:uncharacterized protein